MPRRSDTAEKKVAFIAELRARGTVYHAALAAGIGRRTAYRWREEDDQFAEEWGDATEDTTEVLEDSMYQRAIKGDTIAGIFLLKARRPDVYREKQAQQSGPVVMLKAYPAEMMERLP